MARVAISKLTQPINEDKVYDAVKKAVDNLGGIHKFVKSGETVLIKPNFVSPRLPPVTTDVRVVRAVALQVKEAGAKPIIGESTSAMTCWWREGMTTEGVMDVLGVLEMAKKIGVEVTPFDKGGEFQSVKAKIPGAIVMQEAEIAELALKVDKIIPLPVIKTSMEGGGISGCIKVLHALPNTANDRLRWHRTDLWQKLVDILKLVRHKIPLCVVDGIKAMEGDGPIHGTPVDLNVILAGDDPVATDAIAAKTIGFEYPHYEVGPISLAHSQSLGMGDPSKIEVVGENLDNVKRRLRMASCEIVTPNFEGVTLYEGATCRTCKAWIKFTLYMLKDSGFFEDLKNIGKELYFFVGLEPPLPTDLDKIEHMAEKALIIVFGDCAAFTTRSSYWVISQGSLKGKVLIVPGCPPFACVQQASQIREALGLEITEKDREAFKYVPT